MGKVIDLRANGKILITGEYLVLAGAKALAIPLKFGQHLHAEPGLPGLLKWRSLQPAGQWFDCELDIAGFQIRNASSEPVAKQLAALLQAAQKLNPQFLIGPDGHSVVVEANYPVAWGLGSSSSLISMVAKWAEVSPFMLFKSVSNGSGYDLACADRNGPLFYQIRDGRPEIEEIEAGVALKQNTRFGWLGKKQSSRSEVDLFNRRRNFSEADISRVSELSDSIARASSFRELSALVTEHEKILGRILSRETLSNRFREFPGVVKSLGAWGGDFAMFVSEADPAAVVNYLLQQNIPEHFTFDQIIAKRDA